MEWGWQLHHSCYPRRVLQKPSFRQLRGSFFALAQVDGIIFGRFLEDLGAVGALFRQGRHTKKPAQVIRRGGTVFYKLGNQHPGYWL